MLQILLSWFFIGFIYLTVGSLCMNFLSRYCSIVERYNVVDRLILGLCTLIAILFDWTAYGNDLLFTDDLRWYA